MINKENLLRNFNQENNKNAQLYSSLGSKLYYSILKNVDCIIGNSSSGLTEAPFLGLTSINIGNRQERRTQAGSVINIPAKFQIIENKIRLVLKKKIKRKISDKNYLKAGATKKVVKIIERLNFSNFLKKSFYDLKQTNYIL